MLIGSKVLEEFIDHIERDDFVRLRWLKRIRQSGFDQALSEYRETLMDLETHQTNICRIDQSQWLAWMYLIALGSETSFKLDDRNFENMMEWYQLHGFHHFLCNVNG